MSVGEQLSSQVVSQVVALSQVVAVSQVVASYFSLGFGLGLQLQCAHVVAVSQVVTSYFNPRARVHSDEARERERGKCPESTI